MKRMKRIFLGILVISLLNGCVTHSTPHNTSTLDFTIKTPANPDKYQSVTFLPFMVHKGVNINDSKFVENFSAELYARLRYDHSGVFQEISFNNKKPETGKIIVTGTIRKYRKGSYTKRSILIGLGVGLFEGEMVIKDSLNGKILLSAPFNEISLVSNNYGSKTFRNLVTDTAVAIAKTVALWKQKKITR